MEKQNYHDADTPKISMINVLNPIKSKFSKFPLILGVPRQQLINATFSIDHPSLRVAIFHMNDGGSFGVRPGPSVRRIMIERCDPSFNRVSQ